MYRLRFAVALTILFGVGLGRSAWAHTIAVVRPDRSDQMLVEAFSRLCGELRMYGLQVKMLEAIDEAAAADTAVQPGKPPELVGGVSLIRTPGQASARIWVAANAPGKENVRITVSVADADAPSLLAIRAADLLRASLRDLRGTDPAAPTPADKPDKPDDGRREAPAKKEADATVTATALTPPTPHHLHRWSVFAAPTALIEIGKLGTGWGATVEARARVSSRLELALAFTAPVRGQSYQVLGATAHVRQELATVAIALRLFTARTLDLDVFQGAGVMHLSVHGEAQSPWIAQDTSAWTAASSTGTTAHLALTQHWELQASAAVVFLLPRPIVDVGDVSYIAHQPFVLVDAGLSFAF
jgi:hypothetical protein